LVSLLLAMFVIAVGYGFLLPILPFMIERIAGTPDPATLSRHTGLLTGTYTLALFLFAPLWGRVTARRGRRPVILLGLVGFASTLALFALADNLPLLYLGRLINGLFASAITPAAYALVGDPAPSKEWRAHRFALLNIAGASGFLVGPMLGGFTLLIAREFLPGLREVAAFRSPFFVTSGFAFLVALAHAQCDSAKNRPARGSEGVRQPACCTKLQLPQVRTCCSTESIRAGSPGPGVTTLHYLRVRATAAGQPLGDPYKGSAFSLVKTGPATSPRSSFGHVLRRDGRR